MDIIRGSYCLCIRVKRQTEIKVGSLGAIDFPRGRYIYVGSALNSLLPRLARHIRTNRGEGKAIYWHIDYLLRDPGVEIEAIYTTDRFVRMECKIAAEVAERGKPVPRFGCSDCACQSHLYKVDAFDFIREIGLKKVKVSNLASSPSPR